MAARCPLAAPHRGFASRAPPVKKSALLSQRRRAPNDSGSPLECLGSHDHPRPCHWDPIPGDQMCPLVKSGTGTESIPLEHQRRKVGAKGGVSRGKIGVLLPEEGRVGVGCAQTTHVRSQPHPYSRPAQQLPLGSVSSCLTTA